MEPNDYPSSKQVEIYRRMTMQERWQAATKIYWNARRAKEAETQRQHPEWPEQEVRAEVSRLFLQAAMVEC
jgi:hypothetical protein